MLGQSEQRSWSEWVPLVLIWTIQKLELIGHSKQLEYGFTDSQNLRLD